MQKIPDSWFRLATTRQIVRAARVNFRQNLAHDPLTAYIERARVYSLLSTRYGVQPGFINEIRHLWYVARAVAVADEALKSAAYQNVRALPAEELGILVGIYDSAPQWMGCGAKAFWSELMKIS